MTLLPLAWKPLWGRDCFYVSKSNEEAFKWVSSWPWPLPSICLYGPAGCGKTHLGAIWDERLKTEFNLSPVWGSFHHLPQVRPHGVYILQGGEESIPESALFTFYNDLSVYQASCLWLSRTPPSHWPLTLPDLASRVRSMPAVAIHSPDDVLLHQVVRKSLEDIGLKPSARILSFLVRRMPRSFASAAQLASLIQLHHGDALFSAAMLKKMIDQLHLIQERTPPSPFSPLADTEALS